jgi:hypothetical protein
MAANWLAHWVIMLKKLVHTGLEYGGLDDPTRETIEKIWASQRVKLLEDKF